MLEHIKKVVAYSKISNEQSTSEHRHACLSLAVMDNHKGCKLRPLSQRQYCSLVSCKHGQNLLARLQPC
eukprot:1143893-Pelagomonas_calceolata.AAC.21